VKRLLAFVVGAFGVRAILRRRRGGPPQADALREKLAAQRSQAPVAEPEVAPEPVAEPEPEPRGDADAESVDARRAEVHARARRQIDDLSSS
jgi:hypothetical protein